MHISYPPAATAKSVFSSHSSHSSHSNIPLIPIAAKRPLNLLAPAILLLKPTAAEELTDAGVVGLLLGRLQWHKAIKVLVD